MWGRWCSWLCAAAVLVAVAGVDAGPAGAATPREDGPWLFWSAPTPAQSYTSLSQRITPRNLAPTTYWSTQWFWNGAPEGGYAGIQTDGWRADGTVGPMALFSVWDATHAIASKQSACIPFSGEGEGMSCRAPITVTAGDTYRTDIVSTRTDRAGRWWHATITDETTHAVADLGEIAAPVSATARMPASFVEYFGRAVECGQEPIVTSDFEPPVVTPAGTESPLASGYDHASARTCARALVTPGPTVTTMTAGGPQPSYVANVHAAATENTVAIGWDDAISDGGSPITGYTIEASADDGAAWSDVASTSAAARSASMTMATGQYLIRVAARNGAGTGAFSDPTPLLRVGAVTVALTGPTAAITLSTSIAVAWSGGAPSGVDHYVVQQRSAPWNAGFSQWSAWLPASKVTARTFTATYGRTYCFRAQTVERAGFASPYSAERCTTVPLRASSLAYSPGWTRVSGATLFAGKGETTTLASARATHTKITAKGLWLVATRCPSCGTVDALWNGTRVASVDLGAPTTQTRQPIALTTLATAQTGTLTIVVTSTGKPVTLEGLAVSGN